ncbi:hypothetical protein GDO86_015491 [Hymenochirus boettgeri]|uniref:CD40 ligand n=1 Tax=Hymenochirus boettgeri TaxID=247094 RepID=A0A8T2JT44_9PIPI|nr:hypothetical protein GDO86_015491 [Hymenochirus boettgeri]
MINTHTQSPPGQSPHKGSFIATMKSIMWIFTLFILAQIIGTSLFGVYIYKRLDKIEEEMSFSADYLFIRRIQKCLKHDEFEPTLLDCKEVVGKFRKLMSETISAAHLVGEKSNNKEVLKWMEKGYSSMLKQISYANGKLKVEISGIYYVYSQVSFCMNSSRAPFLQYIYLSRPQETDKLLLKGATTFISLTPDCALHSIQQGGVFNLKQNDQLFVNVTDSSLVNYSPGHTYFGMFKL